jgi:tetratricopeptide (TPR) repeat protein
MNPFDWLKKLVIHKFEKNKAKIYQQIMQSYERFISPPKNLAQMVSQTEKYLKFTQSRFPGEREWRAKFLHLLAELYRKQGRYEEADTGYQQALEIFKDLRGENHPDVAISLNNLASLYQSQGRYEKAEPLYKQTVEIFKGLRGENHPDVAISLNNLAELYRNQGRYEQAESLYQQAFTILKLLWGENHPHVATSLNNLASLYQSQEQYEKAEPLYKQTLNIFKGLRGENHPDVATSLNNLAELYRKQRRYEEAEPLSIKALQMTQHLLGKHHPHVAQSLNNLGLLYSNQKRYEEAQPLLREALEMRKRILGENHPDVADSLNNLAILLAVTNRPKEALAKMKEATEVHDRIISRVFGASSEKDRLRYLDQIRGTFNLLLSLVWQQLADSPEAVQIAFDLVLKRKMLGASASAAFSQAIYSGRYPHLVAYFQQLRQLSDRIFNLTFSPPKADENQTIEQFNAQQTVYKQQLAQLETEYDNLEKQLTAQVPEIRLQEQLQTANRRAVALELPEGSTLVEFVQFRVFDFINNQWQGNQEPPFFKGGVEGDKPSRYLAFILPAGQEDAVQMVDLGPAENIDRLIEIFRESVVKPDCDLLGNNPPQPPLERGESLVLLGARRKNKVAPTNNQPSAGIELRNTIINPLKNIIGESKHWIVAPDGNLNLLPLQILPLDETGQQRLMDDRTITYLSVGRDILRGKVATSRPVAPAMILADPDFDLGKNPEENQAISPTLSGSDFTRAPGTRFLGESVLKP